MQTAAQSRLDERRVQPYGELGQLVRGGLGMGPGLRIAVQAQRGDQLLDQPRLTVRGGTHGAQMARFKAESPQIRHQLGHGHHLGVVAALGSHDDEPVGLPLLQLLLVDLGGRQGSARPIRAAVAAPGPESHTPSPRSR